jgi:hypothetical protein
MIEQSGWGDVEVTVDSAHHDQPTVRSQGSCVTSQTNRLEGWEGFVISLSFSPSLSTYS